MARRKSVQTKGKPRKIRKPSTTRSKAKKRAAPTLGLQTLFPEYRKQEYSLAIERQQTKFVGELQKAYLHRGLALYLGAGVSQSVGLPSWPELVRSLTVNMMTRRVASAIEAFEKLTEKKRDELRWETISSIRDDLQRSAEYDKPILMMARAIKDEFGERLPQVVARQLYGRLLMRLSRQEMKARRTGGRSASWLPSSPLLDAIVALTRAQRDAKGVQAIVNYNFDDIIDEKLRKDKVRCKTVLSGRDKVPPGTLPCYHVHGALRLKEYGPSYKLFGMSFGLSTTLIRNRNKGNFVFSEDEYHEEYSDAYKWSNMTQMNYMGRYTGLFVGLSMEDPNIRRLIDVTHRQYPEVMNYAILKRRKSLTRSRDAEQLVLRNLFENVETASFEKIGVNVIWVDSFDDIPGVLLKICDFEPTSR